MYNQSPNSIGPDGKPRGLLCKLSLLDSSLIIPTATPVGLFQPLSDLCSAVSEIPLPLCRLDALLDAKLTCFLFLLADKNPIDCLYKTWQAEGVKGLYKGTSAHLARIAPHTVRFSHCRRIPVHEESENSG